MTLHDIELVEYRPEYQPDFERLNLSWLEANALLEPPDLEYLRDPQRLILADGGQVFVATRGQAVVGVCAAVRMSPSTFELAKLAVAPEARGLGLGRRLCEAVTDYAREHGAEDIVLTSNTVLATAIRLYESLGFQHEAMPDDVRYETANVFMRLRLR